MKKKDVDIAKFKKEYEEGLSQRDLAKIYNVGQTTIRRWMKDFNVKPRSAKESKQTTHYQEKMKDVWASQEVNLEKKCEQCGEIFLTKPHLDKKFCSKECQFENLSNLHRNRIKKICPNCKKEIEIIPSRVKTSKQNFCSRKCHNEWRSKNTNGSNSPSWRRVVRNCGYCHKELSIPPSRLASEKVYCNKQCMAKDYEIRFAGENSPTWKGGLTKKNYGQNWWSQRRKTRERDLFNCVRCGKSEHENGQELSVHHIKLFRLCSNYQEANELKNLVSLCRECHSFVHSNQNINKEFLIDEDIV